MRPCGTGKGRTWGIIYTFLFTLWLSIELDRTQILVTIMLVLTANTGNTQNWREVLCV